MKKPFKIIYYLFFVCIGVIAVLLIISVLPITGNIKFMIVQSGSMEPEVKTGSIVIVKPVSEYKIGDIISFGKYSKAKAPTTHRIFDIKVNSGIPVYITKGDANNAPDQKEVSGKEIIGKVLFDVPYLGYAVAAVRKPFGFMLILIVPAVVIVGDEIRKIWKEIKGIKSKKKDKEQDREIEELKEDIEELKGKE